MARQPVRRIGALEAAVSAGAFGLAILIVMAEPPTTAPRSTAEAEGTLRRDPLNPAALRLRALAMTDPGRTRQLLEFVLRRSWRDGPTDAWLLQDRLTRGDLPGALACADALLRLDPQGKTRSILFPLLTAAAGFVEARPPLAERLSAAPWWRQDFLQHLSLHGDPAAAAQVFADMARGPAPPTPVEYAPLVERLAAAGDVAGALAAWRQAAARIPGNADPLRDGDFTQPWDRTPFTWRPASGVGAVSEARDEVEGPARRALRVDYDGFSAPTLPAQLLVLAPGHWRLTWQVRAEGLAEQRLYWRVRCAEGGAILAGAPEGPDASPTPGWRPRELAFAVPPDHCPGQWLELAAAPGERRADVAAVYAAFRLAPDVSSGGSAPPAGDSGKGHL